MKRSKIGQWMYNWVSSCSLWLSKHNILYWVLMYTWALVPTLLGNIAWWYIKLFSRKKSIVLCGHKYIVLGKSWGGIELGSHFIVCEWGNMKDGELVGKTVRHELGHTYQVAVLGIFVIFLGWIPSVVRYHYRNWKWEKAKKSGKTIVLPDYDTFWYEGSATYVGTEVVVHR